MREAISEIFVHLVYWLMCFFRVVFLSGKTGEKIHNLVYYSLGRLTATQPEHKRKFEMLWDGIIGKNTAFVEWQRRVYSSAPAFWKCSLKGVFARRLLVGSAWRRFLKWRGYFIPTRLIISLNSPKGGCNLHCKTCFANVGPVAEMPRALLEKILRDQEEIGVHMVTLSGGEPFLYPDLLDVVEKFPKTTFFITTNATTISENDLDRMARLGNSSMMIALEGFKEQTDAIRGEGVYQKIIQTMEACRERKIVYTVTITLTRNNFEVTLGDDFLKMLQSLGCYGVSYSSYVPLGKNPHPEWRLTDEMSKILVTRAMEIKKFWPLFVTVGINGSGLVGHCDAANQNMHILPDGSIEPCVFAKWTDKKLNINNLSILEITASEFFRDMRDISKLSIEGMVPCRLEAMPIFDSVFAPIGVKRT